jgi:hypothetical protein
MIDLGDGPRSNHQCNIPAPFLYLISVGYGKVCLFIFGEGAMMLLLRDERKSQIKQKKNHLIVEQLFYRGGNLRNGSCARRVNHHCH